MSENQWKEAHWETITVESENADALETFLRDKGILFEGQDVDAERKNFLVRTGMDYNEAMFFVLRCWGDTEDADTFNELMGFLMMCEFPEPQYAYEIYERRKVENY